MAAEEEVDLRIAPGVVLADKYRLVREIGRGGVGVVYEAEHLRLRQRVAMKILSSAVLDEPHVNARFEREARAMASLRSPYVATVSDVDVLPNGAPYMVMELLEGRDLQRELRERGSLPAGEAVQIALLACRGLAAVHAANIVHRDLKPSNLFLVRGDAGLAVKVMDFGVSKIENDDILVTHDGSSLGTPAYMAPEQVRSARDVDARADIWSLGVILFRSLAGTLPFEGQGITGMAVAISNDAPKSLAALRPQLPPALVAVIERMLSKNPEARFATIAEVTEALAPFADETFDDTDETDPKFTPPAAPRQPSEPPAHVTSHVRSSRADFVAEASQLSSSLSVSNASPPPKSRVLMFLLPALVSVIVLGAFAVVATRMHRDPPPIPAASAVPTVATDPSPSPSPEPSPSPSPSPSATSTKTSILTPTPRPVPMRKAGARAAPAAASSGLPPLL